MESSKNEIEKPHIETMESSEATMGNIVPPKERPKKLSSNQVQRLKRGFPRVNDTPEEAAQRDWRGMTLEAIANKFSDDEKLTVTARMVRYYYQELKEDGNNPPIPLRQGRAGKPAKQPVIVPAHASLRALTRTVWALTGFSIPEIHRLYAVVAKKKGWKLVSIQHFRKIISELNVHALHHTPSRNLMERHSLRILVHQIVPTEESRNIWVLLIAFEPVTGFIHLSIFKTQRGAKELSATAIKDFITDTQDKLKLPIYRLEISGLTLETIGDLGSQLPDHQVIQGAADNLMAEYPIPENLNTAGRFCDFLSGAVAAYIENIAKPKLIEARKTIFDEGRLLKTSLAGSWSQKRIRPKYPETPKKPLLAFCKAHLHSDEAVSNVQTPNLRMLIPS